MLIQNVPAGLGPIGKAQENLRATLAKCFYFQQWAGVSTEAEALNRIGFTDIPPPQNRSEYTLAELKQFRPFALVYSPSTNTLQLNRITGTTFQSAGSLNILFERETNAKEGQHNATPVREFENQFGLIMRSCDFTKPGLAELSGPGGDGLIMIRSMTGHGPVRTDEDDQNSEGDCMNAMLEIRWGLDQI